MEWTIRLEVKTGRGDVESLALATITRPAAMAAAAEVGLSLAEGKALLARLQAEMVRRQLAEQVARGRVCPRCRAALRIKDRRPRRLQTLFGTLEVEAPGSVSARAKAGDMSWKRSSAHAASSSIAST